MIVMGHRGWPARYPENTLAGFAAAVRLGVDSIEVDVHVTADDRLVVIHDEEVDRTTDGSGLVRAATLAELKKLDAGSWFADEFAGERIPTLEEVMEIAAGKVSLAVEVKNPRETTGRLNGRLVPLARSYPGYVIVHSFDADYIPTFRVACPDVDTGYLCAASPESIALAVEMGCTAIHPNWRTITPELNAAIRDAGLNIMAWVARTGDDCRDILSTIDTDAIGTDCPDVLMRVLKT